MIVKVGGSVAGDLARVVKHLKLAEKALVVPGGWIFADSIRELGGKRTLSNTTLHWMAIAAMDIYGYYIADHGLETVVVHEVEDIAELKGAYVLLLHPLLRKYDELPHSWDVTSDSIAVWLAAKLGESVVVKVTAAGGILRSGQLVERIGAEEILGMETVVDRYTPELLLKYGMSMFVCGVEELKDYILRGRARGTLIEGR